MVMLLHYLKGLLRQKIVSLREIDVPAGRPSGRRPFITTGGMGASAPIIYLMSNLEYESVTEMMIIAHFLLRH